MKKGERNISVNSELITIHRKNREVDILPLLRDDSGLRVDVEGIVTIGYGDNTVQTAVGDVILTTF